MVTDLQAEEYLNLRELFREMKTKRLLVSWAMQQELWIGCHFSQIIEEMAEEHKPTLELVLARLGDKLNPAVVPSFMCGIAVQVGFHLPDERICRQVCSLGWCRPSQRQHKILTFTSTNGCG